MARKPGAPLQQADVEQFLAQGSDFALEMAALAALRDVGFHAEHAATYIDPVTGRLRAYDIRARWIAGGRSIRLAVECKNLLQSAPLLVHATPRLPSEAYHTVVTRRPIGNSGHIGQHAAQRHSVYLTGEPVGRQTEQPTKDDKGEFKSSDSASYDKWLQAVNGCLDLIKEAVQSWPSDKEAFAVVPILVIPTGALWQIDYRENGQPAGPVHQIDQTSLILRHSWQVQAIDTLITYDISHLEIVTLPTLQQRVKDLIGGSGLLAKD